MEYNKIKISVIVLFYHGEQWVDSCVNSLENQSLSRSMYEIVLVDNGGTTPSVKKYTGRPNIKVVNFPVNYGFAGGNNRALEYTHGNIVFLLNQDTVAHYNCLEGLLDAFNRYQEAGIISANMLMVSATKDINQSEAIPDIVGLYRLSRLGYAVYKVVETENDIIPVDFISGAVLAFRKTMIKDVGGFLFDEKLGSYMEDLDLSLRTSKSPWKMYVHNRSVVYHYRDTAFAGKPSYMLGKFVHISGNRLLIYYNHLKRLDFFKRLPVLLMGIPLKVARIDTEKGFNILRALVATLFLPFVAVYFGLRLLADFETSPKSNEMYNQFSMNNNKLMGYVGVLIGLVFCIIGVFYFRHQNWQAIYVAIQGIKYQTVIILLGLSILSLLIGALRFKGVLHRMGYQTGFPELFSIITAGQFSSVMTPIGIGNLVIVPFLKERFRIPMGTALLLGAIDRLLAFYLLSCFVLLGLVGYKLIQGPWWFVTWVMLLWFFGWSFFKAIRISDEAIHQFGVPAYGGEVLYHVGHDFYSQYIMCVSMILRFSIIIIQFLVITGIQGYALSWISGWMIISLSFMLGTVSMIPMGLISRDAAIIALSSQAGIPAADGLMIVLLLRVISSAPTVALGMVCGLWSGKTMFKHP